MRARFIPIACSMTALRRLRAGTALATNAWLAGCDND
jgi:hypothetical protein